MSDMKRLLSSLEKFPSAEKQKNLLESILIELQYVLFRIQLCLTLSQANEFFDGLEEAQLVLVKLSTRKQIKLSAALQQFTIDFSDVYDNNIRKRLFNEINYNKYIYGDIVSPLYKILADIQQGVLKPLFVREQQQLISNTIKDLLCTISTAKEYVSVDGYFEKLLIIQELLSKAVFVYDILLDDPLMIFIHDCERLDDVETRVNLFKRIKQGEYNIFD